MFRVGATGSVYLMGRCRRSVLKLMFGGVGVGLEFRFGVLLFGVEALATRAAMWACVWKLEPKPRAVRKGEEDCLNLKKSYDACVLRWALGEPNDTLRVVIDRVFGLFGVVSDTSA